MKITQKTKQSKSPEATGKKQDTRFKKGQSGNPDGRPQGSKNFSTLMDEAVKEIAKLNKISTAEVWQVLIKRGYSEAKDGNYMFFKDLMDRYWGKAIERHELTGKDGADLFKPNKEEQEIINKALNG